MAVGRGLGAGGGVVDVGGGGLGEVGSTYVLTPSETGSPSVHAEQPASAAPVSTHALARIHFEEVATTISVCPMWWKLTL